MRLRLLALIAALLLAGAMAHHTASAAQPQTDAANAAVHYIESLQNADGGFPAFGEDSSPGSTIDAVFALKAAGVNPATVTNGGHSPIDYLQLQAATYSADAGGLAKLILWLRLLGLDVTSFGGVNLLSGIDADFDDTTSTFGDDNFDQALFVLAGATFQPSPEATRLPAAAAQLRSLQQADGGWEFSAAMGSDSNTTALVVQALLAAGDSPGHPVIRDAVGYLHSLQNADGGLGFLSGADTDPNSTALVIQALVAASEAIDAHGPWDRGGGHTPMAALLSFRNSATGAFQYGGADSAFATYQAVPALLLAPFPRLATRIVVGPTPVAPTVIAVTPSATPTPVVVLPGSGSRADGSVAWWPLIAVATGGAAIATGALVRRRR